MANPLYVTACPNCGAELHAHVGHPQTAPWQCQACSRGWWTVELAPEARKAWRPEHGDHLGDIAVFRQVHGAREMELLTALERRTSARAEFLPLLTKTQLTALAVALTAVAASYPLAATFLVQVQAALTAAG